MGETNASRPYYEIFSLDPLGYGLPVLRKVIIQWLKNNTGYYNYYAGW